MSPGENEIATFIVRVLNLEISPDQIDVEQPLFNDGLGLDSIDALEIALEIHRVYGIEIKTDDERNQRIFASLRNLSEFIFENRTATYPA